MHPHPHQHTHPRMYVVHTWCWREVFSGPIIHLIGAPFLFRVAERTSRYEPSETDLDENEDTEFEVDEADYAPYYQRVFISGEETSSVSTLFVGELPSLCWCYIKRLRMIETEPRTCL